MLISKFRIAKQEDIASIHPALPQELVAFLKKYNGGETPETTFSIGETKSDIVAFYGVGDVKYSYSDVEVLTYEAGSYLPIAFDSFGNKIVISLETGSIGFWDHETGEKPIVLAESLKGFLALVESKKVDPKHTKPVEQREQELISRGRGSIITDALREMWQQEIDKYANIHQEEVVI